MNNNYRFKQKYTLNSKIICDNHGLVDSVNNILRNFNRENVKLANVLLKAF